MSGSTIFARATGPGRAGVMVYRISGPRASDILRSLTGRIGEPRMARRVSLRDSSGDLVDDGLALWFPGPHSFTGEDVAELHLHGSLAVEARLNDILIGAGLEPAGPGAFTWRAFLNGKMDLTQTEGLSDLLEAETALQHRQAMGQYGGELRKRAETWRDHLIAAMASLDSAVDFPDEEDIPAHVAEEARSHVKAVEGDIASVLEGAGRARRISGGLTVALVGPPNAGKSSLFNRLLDEERAIVSPEAGTTRDIVSAVLDWNGHRVTLLDMAGLREESGSAIETEGIKRATAAATEADVRLLCWPAGGGSLPAWLAAFEKSGDILLRTKADLATAGTGIGVSLVSDEGLDELRNGVSRRLNQLADIGLAPKERQRALLSEAHAGLSGFELALELGPEVAAETLRSANQRLEELTGRIAPDDVLDNIFSSFCIGK